MAHKSVDQDSGRGLLGENPSRDKEVSVKQIYPCT
jgi:hypothetical protein